MDDSGILNDELMNLVSKRVSSRDKIVELYEKYTKDKLDAIVNDLAMLKLFHTRQRINLLQLYVTSNILTP
uniref:Hypotheticial protein n=1 Tax=Schistosoma japonicum TaxID=6182 RepID=C1L3R8_SCHJA|nr:hypotheticial protein [Schistosoma japonicum]